MSSYSMITALVAASSLFASVNGHMTMKTPAPYGASTLNTSPLDPAGLDFPCKQRDGVYAAASTTNSYAIGADVPLSFSGSASHGGGSCQISLSSDKAPTKNSKWQVIHSIEGGCPVKGSSGNTGSDTYTFKVPEGVVPGDYTLAWTWFNRVGNREMYMNCAPFTVTGGSSKTKRSIEARKASPLQAKRDTSANFPAMFIANICGGTCTTAETFNVAFPNPGAFKDEFGTSDQKSQTPTCSCNPAGGSAAVTPVAGGGSGSSSASSAAAGAATTVAAAGPVSSAASAVSAPSSAATSAAASAPASAATSVAAASASGDSGVLSTAVATVTAASTAAASVPTGSSTGPSGKSQSCSGGASMVCSADGTQFGLCNNGAAVMQSVASGTKCMGGNIVAA